MSNSDFRLVCIFSLFVAVFIFSASPVFCAQTIRVGVHESKPLAVIDSSGPPNGIYPEVVKEIARQAGWQIKWEKVTWLDGLEKIKTGKLDLLGPIAPTPEREKIFRFSKEPVIVDWGQIYLTEDSPVKPRSPYGVSKEAAEMVVGRTPE